jgi:hypothetical protein
VKLVVIITFAKYADAGWFDPKAEAIDAIPPLDAVIQGRCHMNLS